MKARRIILIISSSLFCLVILLAFVALKYKVHNAELHIDPSSGNYLYIKSFDTTVNGIDKDGTTYFFLPSYADISSLDQSSSPGKLYLTDGSLIVSPVFGITQDVLVDLGTDDLTPWKICFMKSDKLHTIFLEFTDSDIDDVTREDYSNVSVKLVSPSGAAEFIDYDGLIKGRGNATWDLGGYSPPKKPYEIRFDVKHGIGDFTPRKKWVLLANAYEGTGILNKMILDTARKMNMPYVSDSEWADVYSNGNYIGNYLICSEVQQSASSLVDTGGYIIEKNDAYFDKKESGFRTPHDAFTVKAPDFLSDTDLAQLTRLTDTVDRELHHRKPSMAHINPESFTKWYILEELFYNEDALITSCFFYSTHDKTKLYAGPPWDFDGTCGESADKYLDYTGSILDEDSARNPLEWYSLLYENSVAYRQSICLYFNEYLPIFEELILSGIDEYYDIVSSSMSMNQALYGREGYDSSLSVPGYYDSVYNNFRFTKRYLYNRLQYLSGKWGAEVSISAPKNIHGYANITHTVYFKYPNGHTEQMTVNDGSLLDTASLPDFDRTKYKGWQYEVNKNPFSPLIPIYEDVSLTPRPIS